MADDKNMPPDMANLIEVFFRTTTEIVDPFPRKLDEEPAPARIYHYTDACGLRGILESGKLWFTDIFYLNDPSELKHGVNHAVEALNRAAKEGPPEVRVFSDSFADLKAASRRPHNISCAALAEVTTTSANGELMRITAEASFLVLTGRRSRPNSRGLMVNLLPAT